MVMTKKIFYQALLTLFLKVLWYVFSTLVFVLGLYTLICIIVLWDLPVGGNYLFG